MEHAAHHEDHGHLADDPKVFGFWVYLMTDLVIFASLFACFLVLRHNTFGGPTARELFHLPSVLIETLILLTSSLTCALGMLAVTRHSKPAALFCFGATFLLGASFLYFELTEFKELIEKGFSWKLSAFLSSFLRWWAHTASISSWDLSGCWL